MKIGILGAMTCEITLIKESMNIKNTRAIGTIEYFEGTIGNIDIVLCRCGIGKANSAICSTIMIEIFKVTHLINTGVSGGLSKDVSVFDIVLSTNTMHHDLDKDILDTNPPYNSEFIADTFLLSGLRDTYNSIVNPTYKLIEGRIVTGDVFVSDDGLKMEIIKGFDPHAVDMESAVVGQVAYCFKIPYMAIRSISDKADDGAELTFDEFAKIAANNSASLLISYIKSL